jgi:dUTP pyrophosphatase
VGLLFSRSSTGARGLDITSVIDASYRGELFIRVTNMAPHWQEIEREKYLAQLVIVPCVTPAIELVDDLEPSARDQGGFGSSDVKRPAGSSG